MAVVPKIGLEIHVSPATRSKLFCGCSTADAEPNANVCEICLGYPGSKPVLNETALHHAVSIGLALSCSIQPSFAFSRKTYFYPDLAKNFQITQFEVPLGLDGRVVLETGKTVRIRRVHLEEDPAALVHESGISASAFSLIDYNRSGHPLVEIVTEPDIESAKEARAFLDELALTLSYLPFFRLGEDAMKADANISINGGARVEIKNITGFRDVERAIENEIARQAAVVSAGQTIEQHTRGFDAATGKSFLLRTKEAEDDYGYIFEPDLPVIELAPALVTRLEKELPTLPAGVRKRLLESGYSPADARAIAGHKALADFLDAHRLVPTVGARLVRVLVSISNYENRRIQELVELAGTHSDSLVELCDWLAAGRISEKTFKDAVIAGLSPARVDFTGFVRENGLLLEAGADRLREWVHTVIVQNPVVCDKVRQNDEKALNFLIGALMRESKGSADPRRGREEILRVLSGNAASRP